MFLSIEHTTIYHYSQPVRFGPHRLMVRAEEGHDVQIRKSGLTVLPSNRIRWVRDVFDNSVAIVDFLEPSSELEVYSSLVVEQYNTNPFDFVLDPEAIDLPFQYPEWEQSDVAPFIQRLHPQDEPAIRNWVRPYLDAKGRSKSVDLFITLGKSVPMFFQYLRREEPGVQSPGETLRKRAGSCRDFALLLMETARHLGVAARFVSGYLCRAPDDETPLIANDATHAWAELYFPGAGWIGFDPTSGILAADLHVKAAVTRDPAQAVPVSGSFVGPGNVYQGMEVRVNARAIPDWPGQD